jgi:hypothetical protein
MRADIRHPSHCEIEDRVENPYECIILRASLEWLHTIMVERGQ